MRPNRRGLLPRGLNTSTVCTSAMPGGGACTTTASSLWANPCKTRSVGSGTPGKARRTCSSNSGAVFAAQPAAFVRSIRRNVICELLGIHGQAAACRSKKAGMPPGLVSLEQDGACTVSRVVRPPGLSALGTAPLVHKMPPRVRGPLVRKMPHASPCCMDCGTATSHVRK